MCCVLAARCEVGEILSAREASSQPQDKQTTITARHYPLRGVWLQRPPLPFASRSLSTVLPTFRSLLQNHTLFPFRRSKGPRSFLFMAPQPPPNNWEVPSYPPQLPQHRFDDESDEDVKAPYDDLIDEYATPYRPNPQHKAYNVGATAFNASKQVGGGPTPWETDAAGKDVEGASSDAHGWAYPPAAAKEVKRTSRWSRVRAQLYSRVGRLLTTLRRSYLIQ